MTEEIKDFIIGAHRLLKSLEENNRIFKVGDTNEYTTHSNLRPDSPYIVLDIYFDGVKVDSTVVFNGIRIIGSTTIQFFMDDKYIGEIIDHNNNVRFSVRGNRNMYIEFGYKENIETQLQMLGFNKVVRENDIFYTRYHPETDKKFYRFNFVMPDIEENVHIVFTDAVVADDLLFLYDGEDIVGRIPFGNYIAYIELD